MNKPDISPMLPGLPPAGSQPVQAPKALVRQPAPTNTSGSRAAVPPTPPAAQAGATPYVDPYLFETGYYASRAEYEELARTAPARIRLRAEAEHARPRRR